MEKVVNLVKGGGVRLSSLYKSQPNALYLLFFVQMWESFSYYGMRAILVLYMISELGLGDAEAFGIYAVSTALAESLSLFGGRVADRVFGFKYAIYLGGILIMFGHLVLSIPMGIMAIYVSMALISVGTGLMGTNCTALLGEFYSKNDVRRDAGFTLFYVSLNVGALLATILCAVVAESFGYHYGFSLAAFGMLLGLVTLFKFARVFESKGDYPKGATRAQRILYTLGTIAVVPLIAVLIYQHEISIYIILSAILLMLGSVLIGARKRSVVERRNIGSILFSVLLLAIFFGFEEQIGSTLVVFTERFSDKVLLGVSIPAASLTTINPIVVLLLGPIVAVLIEVYEIAKKRLISIYAKISVAFLLQSVAFALLSVETKGAALVGANIIACTFGVIAFSELFIGPAVYSHCAKLAPRNIRGLMMGTVMLGYSAANIFSGFLSQYMAIDETNIADSINVYYDGFVKIVIATMVMSVILAIIMFVQRGKWRR